MQLTPDAPVTDPTASAAVEAPCSTLPTCSTSPAPTSVGLIDKGELPARAVGPSRRLLQADVLAYQTKIKTRRREVLRELAAFDQELGLR